MDFVTGCLSIPQDAATFHAESGRIVKKDGEIEAING